MLTRTGAPRLQGSTRWQAPLSSQRFEAPYQSGWKGVHRWWSLASASPSGGSQKTDTTRHTEGQERGPAAPTHRS